MKVADRKSYNKFLEKIDMNVSVLKKSYDNLSYTIIVDSGGQCTSFPFKPTSDLMDSFDEFVGALEKADTITVEIAQQDKVMRSIPYSFNPPKQAGSMQTNINTDTDVSSLLGTLPQSQQLLGTVMQLSSKVERQNVESTYQQSLQMLQFEKMRLEDKLDLEKRDSERLRVEFAAKEKLYRAKIASFRSKIKDFESEDRALGNINIVKDVAKEAIASVFLFKAGGADDDKKTDKYIAMAGLVSGANPLPEKDNKADCSHISQAHSEQRKQVQEALFQLFDGLDEKQFQYANNLIDFVCDESNRPLIAKYIQPLLNGTLTE